MPMIEFESIIKKQKITGVCKNCGKKRSITISEEETVNPFNKNKDGSIKTYAEVEESVNKELSKKINKWNKKFICKSCYNSQIGRNWFNTK